MTHRGIAVTATLLALTLGGCGSSTSPDPTEHTTTTTSVAPSPTPSYATENEVASVIAGGERVWREAADESGECRMKYVLKGDDVTAEVERMTCYTHELTATTRAQIAIRDLGELNIPPSMQGLVTESVAALQQLVDADLESACGPAMADPKDTKTCDEALGAQNWGYTSVTGVLDKWAPYL